MIPIKGYRAGYRMLPCGKCEECLRKYQNDWMLRLNEEFVHHKYKALFVTLTYRPSAVPTVIRGEYVDTDTGEYFPEKHYLSVCKSHVQSWFKRFRTNYMRSTGETGLKYYITSEYGPRTLRPHYHCLIFGVSKKDFISASQDWFDKYGFTQVKQVQASPEAGVLVARYVAKYCAKGSFENPLVREGMVNPTFHLCSKGLGLSYVFRMRDWHLLRNDSYFNKYDHRHSSRRSLEYSREYVEQVANLRFCWIGDKRFSMPRYYVNKIYGEKSFLSVAISDFLLEKSLDVRDEQYRLVQAEHLDWSHKQIVFYLVEREVSEYRQRRQDSRKALGDFYDHGNFDKYKSVFLT